MAMEGVIHEYDNILPREWKRWATVEDLTIQIPKDCIGDEDLAQNQGGIDATLDHSSPKVDGDSKKHK